MRKVQAVIIAVIVGLGIATIANGARNSSGTYSLPVSPAVSGTTITAAYWNTLTSDVANELSSSLDRAGRGGMLAPIRTPDGTVNAPAFSFNSETSTGFYRVGASDLACSIAGTKRWELTSTGETITGTLACTSDFSVNTNKFTVTAASGNTTVGGTLGVTGLSTLTGGVLTSGNMDFSGTGHPVNIAAPAASTDAATKGYVDARFVVAASFTGTPSGASCGTLTQTGSVTASCVRNSAGNYTVTVAGATTAAIVTVTPYYAGVGGTIMIGSSVSPGSGSFTVYTYQWNSTTPAIATAAVDPPGGFSVVVSKL